MKFKTANREWVKNAAIIFLAVLLVLTFFSNTIMNRTLPEVATQMVSNGSITAKVRGTGTVTANGLHEVKATQTREIRAVMVKAGQEVVAGDVLFVMGAGSSEELEAAEDQLRQLQMSYNTTALGNPGFDTVTYNARLKAAKEEKAKADKAVESAGNNYNANVQANEKALLAQAKERLDTAIAVRDALSEAYNNSLNSTNIVGQIEAAKVLYDYPETLKTATDSSGKLLFKYDDLSPKLKSLVDARDAAFVNVANSTALDALKVELDIRKDELKAKQDALSLIDETDTAGREAAMADVATAQRAVDSQQALYDKALANNSAYTAAVEAVKAQALIDKSGVTSPELDAAQAEVDKRTAEYNALAAGNVYAQALEKAKENQLAAQERISAIEEEKASFDRSNATVGVTLTDLAVQINKQKEKIKELSGEEADQVVANVAGSVQSVLCTSGDTVSKDKVMCTIEVPDMGYTLSFSVSNDQAKRLRTGNTATVSNYYWGSEIKAELTSIVTDPKTPQTNKLLTFDLTGDVTAGSELTLSVGEKSASYDTIIPNSSIRSDTNGSFVLMIVAKNSPLGNRYIAQRVGIEVLAADDSNSAVTAALEYGDYVITTSNAPIKSGDQVRMADS